MVDHFQSVHGRHADVRNNDIRFRLIDDVKGLIPIIGSPFDPASQGFPVHQLLHSFNDQLLIIH